MWNAGTSKDYTHYYVTVAAPFFATALDAISDMLMNASIDAAEFDKEKPVILEEYRRKQDNPWGVLYDELYETALARSPYRQTVLGSFESISGLRRDAMADYHRRYYTPDNMVLAVVGDIDPDDALRRVAEAFGGFDRRCNPLSVGESATEFAPGASRTAAMDVNETYMAIALPAPPLAECADVLALDIASTILGEGRSSRLYRTLKEERRVVNAINAGFPTHRHPGIFYVGASLDREKSAAARDGMLEVLRGLASSPPSPAELAKAKRILRNDMRYGTETNTGQSGTIGYYHTLTGSGDFLEHYISRLEAVTVEEVAGVVTKYLSGEPATVMVEPSHCAGAEAAQ